MVRSSSREQWRARKRTLRELRQASFLVSYRTLAFIDANSGALPAQRTAGSLEPAFTTADTILAAACTTTACARLVPQLQPSPSQVLSHR